MLNPFPDLLSWTLLSPFILRVTAGVIFVNLGILKLTREKERWEVLLNFLRLKPTEVFVRGLGGLEILGGVFLITGFATQITALVFSVLLLAEFLIEYKEESILKRNLVFYLLMLAISLSLLFSGAGFFAFDLPL